ncbi:hypothetical protein Bpfe_013242 [Biomphalaria pfeifferi]|uniref:Uncharacterized protein n=1 Tax=Biomphalaria pfeifferi TaxID=112525 RepID=A0AAD8BPG6_BIOPF|nr:hypothetical protein Bpfe_013242 [Biomphalaria pfeifferi]
MLEYTQHSRAIWRQRYPRFFLKYVDEFLPLPILGVPSEANRLASVVGNIVNPPLSTGSRRVYDHVEVDRTKSSWAGPYREICGHHQLSLPH